MQINMMIKNIILVLIAVLALVNVIASSLPSFVQYKIESALLSQPFTLNENNEIPPISHFIRAKIQSRNHRYYKRDNEKYDAKILITEDGMKGHMINQKNNIEYSYYNGNLIIDSWECVNDPTIVAPLVQFKDIVNHLEEIFHEKEIETFDKELNEVCKGMKKFGIVFAETPFVLCATNNELKHVVSEEIWIDILEWSVDMKRIKLIEEEFPVKPDQFIGCMPPMKISNFEPVKNMISSISIPWYSSSRICKLPFLRDSRFCEKDNNEATADCVFLHGIGETVTADPQITYNDYWGNVEDYTPQCKSRIFIRQETKKRGWNNKELQDKYCELALRGNAPGDTVIRNKVLFVHSMGNLILAGAILNGTCSIDKETTKWYDIMGPFEGSKAADMLDIICDNKMGNPLYRFVAEKGGYCNDGIPYPAYRTLQTTNEVIKSGNLTRIVIDNATGSMCGDSPIGIFSRYSVLKILSIIVGYGDLNDGMVEITSCGWNDIKKYTDEFKEKFYLASINHADGTCRSGNSWIFSKLKSPCSYYTDKI